MQQEGSPHRYSTMPIPLDFRPHVLLATTAQPPSSQTARGKETLKSIPPQCAYVVGVGLVQALVQLLQQAQMRLSRRE